MTPRLGCFSPFPHGTSSLSVTKSIQPWTMVRPDSHRIPRVPWYLGALSGGRSPFVYRAVTFCGRLFQRRSTRRRLVNSSFLRQKEPRGPATPRRKRLPAITPSRFRLAPFRSPLLRGCHLFLRILRCFSSPRALYPAYLIQPGVPGHSSRWVAPFGNPRIERLLAATRGLSQQRYVLHRLLVPRHPPCALSSLTFPIVTVQ